MEYHVKKAVKAGNSSAVILPRAWLNMEVRVELLKKTPEIMLAEIIDIIKKHIELKDIIGIYLVGSYARGEEDSGSDIDILVITKNTDKEIINDGIYNILIMSSELLRQKLDSDLFPIGQMIKEAKPILNSDYLDSIKIRVTKRNVKWYIDTTENKLRLIKKAIEMAQKNNRAYLKDIIAYTLILRIKTMHIICFLIKNQPYSKKDFIKMIKKVSVGTNSYECYLAVKNNLDEKNSFTLEEAERLYEYLKIKLSEVKKLLKNH